MTAIASIPFVWLMLAIATVAIVSYMISLFLNSVFGRDGFGTIGNMMVLTCCFFGGIILGEMFGYRMNGLQMNTYLGLGASLGGFLVLAICKQILDRLFST